MPFSDSRDCCAHGWVRRFWQGSPDHRGTEENEGLVVTLLPADKVAELEHIAHANSTDDSEAVNDVATDGAVCWGKAFLVPAAHVKVVMDKLDFREKAGYGKEMLPVIGADGLAFEALSFQATVDNPHFLGPFTYASMSEHIVRSVGPSGKNVDYFLGLVDALIEMSERTGKNCVDSHLKRLARHVTALQQEQHVSQEAIQEPLVTDQ